MTTLLRLCGLALTLFAISGTGAALAQTGSSSDPRAQAQQERRDTQPGNNAPVWREVRSGNQGYTSMQGQEVGVLVQSAGETWRQIRNGPVTVYGGWMLILVVLALVAFFTTKGAIKLREKPTGRMLERFNSLERVTHWTVAISFVVLAASGLILLFGKHVLLPIIGYTLFSWLTALAKNLHNFIGPLFILGLLLMMVVYIRDNFPNAADLQWLAKGGGLLSGKHVPAGRFNAGQKGWFWGGVVLLGIAASASGLILLFPNFDQLRFTMQIAWIVHAAVGLIFMAMGLGHIYIGTIGMEGAYQAMRLGNVDEAWAKEHHELWYNEVKKGGAKSAPGGAVPAGAPHMREKQ
ncbi:MAG: formate dehydrogenase subunit gamma [Betaproteobacteria bacterium]|nr:formate dehydrogenase subunit gamma [Betaproteobacteria bacterium]